MTRRTNKLKIIFGLYLFFVHLLLAYLIYDKFQPSKIDQTKIEQPVTALPTPYQIPETTIAPTAAPSVTTAQTPNVAPINTNSAVNNVSPTLSNGRLMIPVVGVKKTELTDTFNDARSAGRVHNANDIMAKDGTPVVAAADGEIAKFFESKLGGITIYQYSVDKKLVYYYAHLQRRADNLTEHEFVKQGTVIGYVGDTGNAGPGNYHLHFAISMLNDPKRFWEGTEINPFPLLKDGIESH